MKNAIEKLISDKNKLMEDLRELIKKLPENENVQVISEKPRCFSIRHSEIEKNRAILSPEYYCFKKQYEVILEMFERCDISRIVFNWEECKKRNPSFFHVNKKRILLHPEVIKNVDKLLGI